MSHVRIIVEVQGGLVTTVYSNSAKTEVDIIDRDLEKCGDIEPKDIKRIKKLDKETRDMYDVY